MAVTNKLRKTNSKARKVISDGLVTIRATFNNTHITVADAAAKSKGEVVAWATAGSKGYKGSRKSTPHAAGEAAEEVGKKAKEFKMKRIAIKVLGPGSGRESAIRKLASMDFEITEIKDVTPLPHNGVRPRKKRRV